MTAISAVLLLLLGIVVMNNRPLRKACHNLGLTDTPLVCVDKYCLSGNMFVKCEGENQLGSIKARAAYYMLHGAVIKNTTNDQMINIVESSSGNLAIAIHKLSGYFGVNFLCLSDKTTPVRKQKELHEEGLNVRFIQKGDYPDFRSARIASASRLGKQPGFFWLNQYANPMNVRAHYETTGPEIWEQTKGTVRWIVISVGSAGTICGIGRFLKQVDSSVKIVGVEPLGSTLFGGKSHSYIAAGAGMLGPSEILLRYGNCIDYFSQVSDTIAAWECKQFEKREGFNVGLTTGHSLAVGSLLCSRTRSPVVVVSADNGNCYEDSIRHLLESRQQKADEISLKRYRGAHE